jgi:diaminopropionate ammonia-lyase
MPSYKVKHLNGGAEFERPRILLNDSQQPRSWHQDTDSKIENFHKQLPSYGETKLHSLPSVASELGFSDVFVKDESTRFGLPSFKILGASWAIYRTLCRQLGLPSSTTLEELTHALKGRGDVRIVTCTEGNWGRACARMGKYLGVPVVVYVPYFMNAYTRDLIAGEGAEVVQLENGSYDDCLDAVRRDAESGKGQMVLDTSWDGFTEIPQVRYGLSLRSFVY